MVVEDARREARAAKTIYTCPMHPEIEQDHPGECPKCGMALEPKTLPPGEAEEEDQEIGRTRASKVTPSQDKSPSLIT